jgi:predicted transcriptional regulator
LPVVTKSPTIRVNVSTLQEIKTAIAKLDPREKAILAAELFAMASGPDEVELEAALERGMRDVEGGRVRPIEEVRDMIPGWLSKS